METPPPPPPPVPPNPLATPVPLPTPSDPTPIIVQLPPELAGSHGGSTFATLLSGIGIGAVAAAFVSAICLFLVERMRQRGEDRRKLVQLKREDQRQWAGEITDGYVKAQELIRQLYISLLISRTYQAVPDAERMEDHYKRASKMRFELDAIVDRVRVLGTDRTAAAFEALQPPVATYLKSFKTDDNGKHFYPKEAMKALEVENETKELMIAVREELRTPEKW